MMNNLFATDRAYQTNFFLKFQSEKIESRYREYSQRRHRYGLIGYLIISIFLITIQSMDSVCFKYAINCKLEGLSVLSLVAAISALALIHQKQNLHLIRAAMMVISIFFHLNFYNRYEHTVAELLIILQTTLSTSLVFECWRFHLLYNTLSYILLHWSVRIWDMKLIYGGNDSTHVFQNFILYHALSVILIAFIEQNSREKWLIQDSLLRTEKVFQKFFEDASQPIMLIDSNKNVILSNRKGLEVLNKLSGIPADSADLANTRHKPKFLNLMDALDPNYHEVLDFSIEHVTAESKVKSRLAFKKSLNVGNTQSNLLQKPSQEVDDYGSVYDFELSDFIWKGTKAYILTLEDANLSVKNNDILVRSVNKVVNQLEDCLFNLEKDYEKVSAQIRRGEKPTFTTKIVMDLNNLKTSILNFCTVNNYLSSTNKPEAPEIDFNLKHLILYLIETMSVKTLENKIEVNLNFGSGFPEYVSSDPSAFQQMFCNVINNIIKHLKDSTVDITCGVRNILAGGVMLLEFKIEFAQNEILSSKNLKDCFNYLLEDQVESLYHRLLNANELALELGVVSVMLKDTEGGVEVSEGNRQCITLVVPMPHHLPEDGSISSYSEAISSLNLTNTRTVHDASKYTWKKEVPAMPEIKISRTATPNPDELLTMTRTIQSGGTHRSALPSQESTRGDGKHISFAEFTEKKMRDKEEGRRTPNNELTGEEEVKSAEKKDIFIKAKLGRRDSSDEEPRNMVLGKYLSKSPQPSIFKRKPLGQYNRSGTANLGQGPSLLSSLSGTHTNLSAHTSFDEQLVKIIIIYSLLELLSKQPPKKELKVAGTESPGEFSPNLRATGNGFGADEVIFGARGGKISARELYSLVIHKFNLAMKNEAYAETLTNFIIHTGDSLKERLLTALSTVKFSLTTTTLEEILSVQHGSNLPGLSESTKPSPRLGPRKPMLRRNDSIRIKDGSSALDISDDMGPRSDFLDPSNRNPFETPAAKTAMKSRSKLPSSFLAAMDSHEESKQASNRLEPKQEKSSKNWQSKLLPFKDVNELPPSLKDRTKTREKKWVGIVTIESEQNQALKKHYRYKEIFTILAVDDNQFQLMQLAALPQAYKRFDDMSEEGSLYHMILMDLEMPLWDGFEATKAIRQRESDIQAPRTYICGLSANIDEKYRRKSLDAGMDNFYPKPLTVQKLNELVKIKLESLKVSPQ